MSGIRVCTNRASMKNRDIGRFYSWGTKSMIDSYSKVAQVQGDPTIATGSGSKGGYARGGSTN